MKASSRARIRRTPKAPTGIVGFDEITGGGLPRGRTTLLVGGPGAGKTLFALKFLVHGAADCGEPGIFVACEEVSRHVIANAQAFDWSLGELQRRKLFFLDARPSLDLVQSGAFDLGGLLAALQAKAAKMGARRIVFDALDVVLALLPDEAARKRELYRVHEWLTARGFTGVITAKAGCEEDQCVGEPPYVFMEFMLNCTVKLDHRMVRGVSQRSLTVKKYLGSAFEENEAPFLIGPRGLEVAVNSAPAEPPVSSERVSCGVARLDTMLGGGYYRGAFVLVTGSPGTAKTTLGGAFALAALRRGERTMIVSLDSSGSELLRNLSSVAIDLERHHRSGRLLMSSTRTVTGNAETHLMRIKSLALAHRARCIVVDPVSTLAAAGNERVSQGVLERLTGWSKSLGITLVCTSLQRESEEISDIGALHAASLADTWVHLNHLVQDGERKRGIAIIKSRGTAHSNRVCELMLRDTGVTVAE
ncbi:MAG: circadian clock protein KaiC [Usitatibacter sp.]